MRNRLSPGAVLMALLLVAGGALTGCRGAEGVGAPLRPSASGSSASGSPSGSPSAQEPSGEPSASSAGDPDDSGRGLPSRPPIAARTEVTVTGGVQAGVELGCVLLHTTDETYLLIGGDRSRMQVGTRVTVRGQVEPDLMSTCQQGTPLRVLEIQAA